MSPLPSGSATGSSGLVMWRRSGFSLVEALLAVTLLAMVLVPLLGVFRVQLEASRRLRLRQELERVVANQLNLMEVEADSGMDAHLLEAEGMVLELKTVEHLPQVTTCGSNALHHYQVTVRSRHDELRSSGERMVLKPLPLPVITEQEP